MILHCKLRQIQTCRNFFVRQSIGDQIHQLNLPMRQSVAVCSGRACALKIPPLLTPDIFNQHHAQVGWTNCFALPHAADRRYDLQGRSVLQDVTYRAQNNCLQEALRVVVHSYKHDLEVGVLFVQIAERVRVARRGRIIRQDNVTARFYNLPGNVFGIRDHPATRIPVCFLSSRARVSRKQAVFRRKEYFYVGGLGRAGLGRSCNLPTFG